MSRTIKTAFVTVSPPGGGLNARQKVPIARKVLRVAVSNGSTAENAVVGDSGIVWSTTGNSGGIVVSLNNQFIELLPQINGQEREVDLYCIFRPGSANTNGLTFVYDYYEE